VTFADPMGTIVAELRTANIASGRVRTFEPDVGDAKGPREYQRFVVIVDLGGPPVRQILQRLRYVVRCYGATKQDARDLWGDVQDVLHLAGPRLSAGGVAVYNTRDDTGGSVHADPDTGQPYYDGVYEVTAGLRLVG
jgi:hypothetical protein